METLKLKLFSILNNEQKTNLLSLIPNIREYEFVDFTNKNLILRGGNEHISEYKNKYDMKSGKYYLRTNNNKYYYRVERYLPKDDNNIIFIDLITIKDKYNTNIDCGVIQIDRKKQKSNIISLGNSTKCIKSENKNIKFKYGSSVLRPQSCYARDILFQIMIYICTKENIKKIELTDNSNIRCGDHKLNLSYLKTITHGKPHYVKYGFNIKDPDDKKTLIDNYKRYLEDPKIPKKELIDMIKGKANKEVINHLSLEIERYRQEEIPIKEFILMISKDLTNNEYCELVNNIYKKLYIYGGYKLYLSNDYELEI